MVQLAVDPKAVRNFCSLFGPIVKEQIITNYNPDFIIHFTPYSYSFSFLKNEVIIYTVEDNVSSISDIRRFEYMDLIPDAFLTQLLTLEALPSRVLRYRQIGVERLRKEIIDELRLGAITAEDTTAIWDDYRLKIKISPTLRMEQVEH